MYIREDGCIMKITALTENTSADPRFGAEHGLSLYIEANGHRILFDSGQTELFERNASLLGIDLAGVDIAVLSHGHYDHSGGLKRFLELNDSAPVYLHRLANPTDAMPNMTTSSAYYVRFLTEKANRIFNGNAQTNMLQTDELPALQLLEYLRKPYFVANTYAELAAIYNNAYPKHVTLNDEGIPVKTALAENATMLDRYLMLSNPNELGTFNNATQGTNYTPFVLTSEEQQAANELLASRAKAMQIPENPTARDLIEIAYNRLESHTIPYTQAETVGAGYQAYPNYKNTYLYRAIKGMIAEHPPVMSRDYTKIRTLKNKDIMHLIILDAIMGGVELTDTKAVNLALHAFNEFSAELEKTPENIAHLQILERNLDIVLDPVFNAQLLDLMRFFLHGN